MGKVDMQQAVEKGLRRYPLILLGPNFFAVRTNRQKRRFEVPFNRYRFGLMFLTAALVSFMKGVENSHR